MGQDRFGARRAHRSAAAPDVAVEL